MSRGFVKEDDQEEVPMVPPRADLPEGVSNYVTREGMQELLDEKEELLEERKNLDTTDERERRIAANFISAKLQLLDLRIASAQVIDPEENDVDEIRFGARITLKNTQSGKTQRIQIVGVDEADFSKGKIAFTSPLANILIHKKAGESAVLKRPGGDLVFEVLDLHYP